MSTLKGEMIPVNNCFADCLVLFQTSKSLNYDRVESIRSNESVKST